MRIVSGFSAVVLSAALCFSSTTAALANSCQPGQSGCVLPVGVTPPPVQVTTPVETVPGVIESDVGGINWLPILLGLAALGLGAYFLFFDDDEEDVVTPA
jgi:hypothetical protein